MADQLETTGHAGRAKAEALVEELTSQLCVIGYFYTLSIMPYTERGSLQNGLGICVDKSIESFTLTPRRSCVLLISAISGEISGL